MASRLMNEALCKRVIATQPKKDAGMLRRALRSQAFARILGGRHMECAYYFDTPFMPQRVPPGLIPRAGGTWEQLSPFSPLFHVLREKRNDWVLAHRFQRPETLA